MMNDMTYKEAIKNAKHLKAIGQTKVYLRDDHDFPWEHVTSVEPGGSHRLDMATSVWFQAKDPATGLVFQLSFDIEPYTANGKGHYEIDAHACRNVMSKLHGEARKLFSDYLAGCAAKVEAKAKEWNEITRKQFKDAEILFSLSGN